MGKTVGRGHVAVEGSGEYEKLVADVWMMVAICGLKFIRFCQNESNLFSLDNQNYMSEVSRLLIASPGPRLMETFILIIFSSLVGSDAPYSVHFLKYYHLIFHYPSSDGCCTVMETLGY